MYDMKKSGERIRQLRNKHGYTQEALAKKLGIDRSLLSHIEAGKRGCSVDLLVQLSEFFNVTLDLLVLGRGRKASTKRL
jgi:transcriptional regulator with XRE-family HTH domain